MERDTRNQQENEDRKVPATARLDPEVFSFYQEWAVREERSISNVLSIALKRYKQHLTATGDKRRLEDKAKVPA